MKYKRMYWAEARLIWVALNGHRGRWIVGPCVILFNLYYKLVKVTIRRK